MANRTLRSELDWLLKISEGVKVPLELSVADDGQIIAMFVTGGQNAPLLVGKGKTVVDAAKRLRDEIESIPKPRRSA